MTVRPATAEDIVELRKIAPDRVEEVRPSLNTLGSISVLKDDELIAYGALNVFAEAVLVVRPETTEFARVKAIRSLLNMATDACRQLSIAELHTFTKDERFAKFLEMYGFKTISEKALSLTLR